MYTVRTDAHPPSYHQRVYLVERASKRVTELFRDADFERPKSAR